MAYMWGENVVHSYGMNEWGVSTDSLELGEWMEKMRHFTFWLQIVSMVPVLWHLALAFLLHEFLVHGRSPGALERQLRTTGWKVMLAVYVLIVAIEAGAFYCKPAHRPDHKVRATWRCGYSLFFLSWLTQPDPTPTKKQTHYHRATRPTTPTKCGST